MTTTPPPATPTSTPANPPESLSEAVTSAQREARPEGGGRLRGLGSVLGIVISVVALAGVVWWALRQGPPRLPHGAGQLGALVGAIALYGINTLVRSERWHRLLLDDGARPRRVAAERGAIRTTRAASPARAGSTLLTAYPMVVSA